MTTQMAQPAMDLNKYRLGPLERIWRAVGVIVTLAVVAYTYGLLYRHRLAEYNWINGTGTYGRTEAILNVWLHAFGLLLLVLMVAAIVMGVFALLIGRSHRFVEQADYSLLGDLLTGQIILVAVGLTIGEFTRFHLLI
jgi:vacuolar-type H+-ATPase subunit I/STV1